MNFQVRLPFATPNGGGEEHVPSGSKFAVLVPPVRADPKDEIAHARCAFEVRFHGLLLGFQFLVEIPGVDRLAALGGVVQSKPVILVIGDDEMFIIQHDGG